MQGKIIKGVAGQYLVDVEHQGTYDCKAKGIFRKDKEKPMVGDVVEITVLDEENKIGSIDKIYERKNELIRPAVSNIDQALIIFAITNPKPNFVLLDRFLINMAKQDVDCVIVFSKEDLDEDGELSEIVKAYSACGCKVLTCSVKQDKGIDDIIDVLRGKTSTVAGPSGVGKSSLINRLQEDVYMEVGEISEKIDRGKHTTRHSQLIHLFDDTYILDTPGFSSLEIFDVEADDLAMWYPEFRPYEEGCRFTQCTHTHEPVCGVKEAFHEGNISKMRYENYLTMYEQLKLGKRSEKRNDSRMEKKSERKFDKKLDKHK